MTVENSNPLWPLPTAEPEEVGFSAQRLARIHSVLQKYIDNQKVPNLVTLIARHGKIAYFDAQGYMDLDSQIPVKKDTIFRLYSNMKSITGVAIMILYEEDLINLDDYISKYIPAFKNPVVRLTEPIVRPDEGRSIQDLTALTTPARREITIRDCLRHTTGLATPANTPIQLMPIYRELFTAMGFLPGNRTHHQKVKELVEAQAKLPLSFHPGTEWEYHIGYPALGVVIETITAKTLEEFFQKRIFKPLGMKDSSFYLPENKLSRFSSCYQPQIIDKEKRLVAVDRGETSSRVGNPQINFDAGGGGGGVLSSIGDYARFGQMLLNGGELDGIRIISRKTVQLMTSSHCGDLYDKGLGPGFCWGLGFVVYTGSSRVPIYRSVGTYSNTGAAGTLCFIDPKEDLFCICFTQVLNHRIIPGCNYQEDLERLVYQALL